MVAEHELLDCHPARGVSAHTVRKKRYGSRDAPGVLGVGGNTKIVRYSRVALNSQPDLKCDALLATGWGRMFEGTRRKRASSFACTDGVHESARENDPRWRCR